MKVFIASDHAGFELKEKILKRFSSLQSCDLDGYEFEDLGPYSDKRVDYPDFAAKLSRKLVAGTMGVLVCGSGQGVSMTANKFPHIRAALCTNEELAELSRAHNNANVLCLGSRTVDEEINFKILIKFLKTSFEGGRHQVRVEKIAQTARGYND